jgi:hypothetical protein
MVTRSCAGLAGVLMVALLAAAPVPPTETSLLKPLVTISGANSHVTTARCVRITTHEEWAALWLEHVGLPPKSKYDLYFNKAGLPVVDFEHCIVVAVFLGATNNCAGVSAVAGPVLDPEAETQAPVASGDEVLRLSWHGYQTLGNGPDTGAAPSPDFLGATGGKDGGAVDASPFGFFVLPRTKAPLVVQDHDQGWAPGNLASSSARVSRR